MLATGRFTKLAIANPKTAPYGQAAVEVMTKLGLYARLAPRIVKGDNLSQVQQFVISGNAQLGFVALSQVKGDNSGSKWVVPGKYYSPIRQDAVLLKRGADNPAAKAFFGFLKSDAAKAIIGKYGYGLE